MSFKSSIFVEELIRIMLNQENFRDSSIWYNGVFLGEEIIITFAYWIPQFEMCSAENYLE